MKKTNNLSAFTLIELLIVIAVIVYRFYLTACEKPGEDEEDAE